MVPAEVASRKEVLELHHTLVDLLGLMNQPKRDGALLHEAGVPLDRALFPLLVGVDRKGPIGVVNLGEQVGRDYTTVSRQIAKLARLGLIQRRPAKSDHRVQEAALTVRGQRVVRAIDGARLRLATVMFAGWNRRDLGDLARLLRRFVDDFEALPATPGASTAADRARRTRLSTSGT